MLRILRNKKTAKKIWIGLAIIIIPAFTLWGFGSSGRSREENMPAGRISGKNVSALEFKKALAAAKTAAILQFGDNFPEVEKYLDLETQAWERLVLLQETERRKLNVTDREVVESIQKAPYFQKKGVFDNKAYLEILRYAFRLQPRAFEEQTRQNLILAKLYSQITKDVKLSDDEIRREYLKANQELNIHYIASLFSDFSKLLKPGEKEISGFFEKNKTMFEEPPAKDKPTRIPELAEIKEKVKDALVREEAKKMAENKIKECAEKLKKKEFRQAAKASGLKSGETAFFKSSGQIENLGEAQIFWDNAKQLKENEVSGILSNEKGYYIIKLASIKPIDEDKFAKEKKEFGDNILSREKNKAFGKFVEEIKKKAQ